MVCLGKVEVGEGINVAIRDAKVCEGVKGRRRVDRRKQMLVAAKMH